MPQPFRNTTVESVMAYMKAQFSYWTEDETACNFRRMLTLEQYRNPEMANLYQKVLASGPVNYIEASVPGNDAVGNLAGRQPQTNGG